MMGREHSKSFLAYTCAPPKFYSSQRKAAGLDLITLMPSPPSPRRLKTPLISTKINSVLSVFNKSNKIIPQPPLLQKKYESKESFLKLLIKENRGKRQKENPFIKKLQECIRKKPQKKAEKSNHSMQGMNQCFFQRSQSVTDLPVRKRVISFAQSFQIKNTDSEKDPYNHWQERIKSIKAQLYGKKDEEIRNSKISLKCYDQVTKSSNKKGGLIQYLRQCEQGSSPQKQRHQFQQAYGIAVRPFINPSKQMLMPQDDLLAQT